MVLTKHDLVGVDDSVGNIGPEWTAKGGFCVGKSEGRLSKIDYIGHGENLHHERGDRNDLCLHLSFPMDELAFDTSDSCLRRSMLGVSRKHYRAEVVNRKE